MKRSIDLDGKEIIGCRKLHLEKAEVDCSTFDQACQAEEVGGQFSGQWCAPAVLAGLSAPASPAVQPSSSKFCFPLFVATRCQC